MNKPRQPRGLLESLLSEVRELRREIGYLRKDLRAKEAPVKVITGVLETQNRVSGQVLENLLSSPIGTLNLSKRQINVFSDSRDGPKWTIGETLRLPLNNLTYKRGFGLDTFMDLVDQLRKVGIEPEEYWGEDPVEEFRKIKGH